MAYILIAEDVLELRVAWVEALTTIGNVVDGAADGARAWELIQSNGPYDLIILDINMPRQNGLETLKLIRQHDSKVPVLAVTAITDPEIVRRVISSGATDILFKPLSLNEFINAISRLAQK